jgi:release factor glutamine methyltransferase
MACDYGGLIIEALDEVYEPAEDSFLMAKSMKISGGAVLDVGTGTGFLALHAAKNADKVLGVDINPRAVELARRNAERNRIKNARFMDSDLFDNVADRFDAIIFNPPYVQGNPGSDVERAWYGGVDGADVIRAFIMGAGHHLKPEGRVYLLLSSLNDLNAILDSFSRQGFEADVIASQNLFFETLYVIEAFFKGIS